MDGYYAFMLIATAFVLMMTVPALALFYGGMSRSKSVLNMMMMSYVAVAIVGILYVAVGWSMGFGGDGTFFADPFDAVLARRRHHRQLHLRDVPADLRDHHRRADQRRGRRPDEVLGLGGLRADLGAARPTSRWPTWSSAAPRTRSICGRIGAQDYAGGTAVHINAGMAGLVLAVLHRQARRLRPRTPIRPHNLTLTMLGAGLLWIGWYGFNVGSIVFGDVDRRGATSPSSSPRPAAPSPTPRWPPWPRSSAGC